MNVKEKITHTTLGQIISEELHRAGVVIEQMCRSVHMGNSSYSQLKGGAIGN